MKTMVRSIGKSGQISLGKKYSGKKALVEELDKGVWLIKLGEFIPENERWLTRDDVRSDLEEAIQWAEKHPPKSTDLAALESRLQK